MRLVNYTSYAAIAMMCMVACTDSAEDTRQRTTNGRDAAAQNSAEDSGSTSTQIDAQTQDTGAVMADSGSMSPIDGGETQPSDSGTSEADDAGFAMDAQSPSDSGLLADAMASNFTCPPSGPYGSNTGDTSPNIELQDCDGNTVRLHDFCNRKATWMFSLPLW